MDLLQQGSDWLQQMRNTHASQPVTYSRGAEEVTLNATIGKTTYEVDDEYGVRVQAEVIDFLIMADDMVLGGEKLLPEPGDKISVTRGVDIVVFEVMSLAGQGHYRFSDSYGQTLRVHTRQVDRETQT